MKPKFHSSEDLDWVLDVIKKEVVDRPKVNPTEQEHDDITIQLQRMQAGEFIANGDPYYDADLGHQSIDEIFDDAEAAANIVSEVESTQGSSGLSTTAKSRIESFALRTLKALKIKAPMHTTPSIVKGEAKGAGEATGTVAEQPPKPIDRA